MKFIFKILLIVFTVLGSMDAVAQCCGAGNPILSGNGESNLNRGTLQFFFTITKISINPRHEIVSKLFFVAWSALVIVRKDGKKEKYVDLTKDGFKYAVKDPDKLKGIIANQINAYLK